MTNKRREAARAVQDLRELMMQGIDQGGQISVYCSARWLVGRIETLEAALAADPQPTERPKTTTWNDRQTFLAAEAERAQEKLAHRLEPQPTPSHEERARRLVEEFPLDGYPDLPPLRERIAEALAATAHEARAAQKERDALVCQRRYDDWPQIDAALRDVSLSCAAEIRNQPTDEE